MTLNIIRSPVILPNVKLWTVRGMQKTGSHTERPTSLVAAVFATGLFFWILLAPWLDWEFKHSVLFWVCAENDKCYQKQSTPHILKWNTVMDLCLTSAMLHAQHKVLTGQLSISIDNSKSKEHSNAQEYSQIVCKAVYVICLKECT